MSSLAPQNKQTELNNNKKNVLFFGTPSNNNKPDYPLNQDQS